MCVLLPIPQYYLLWAFPISFPRSLSDGRPFLPTAPSRPRPHTLFWSRGPRCGGCGGVGGRPWRQLAMHPITSLLLAAPLRLYISDGVDVSAAEGRAIMVLKVGGEMTKRTTLHLYIYFHLFFLISQYFVLNFLLKKKGKWREKSSLHYCRIEMGTNRQHKLY